MLNIKAYDLSNKLGRGGTADVARVFVDTLGREAAFKYPLECESGQDVDFDNLVKREYSLIGDLTFPGLVRLLPRIDSIPSHLLMEICSGPTLEDLGRVNDVGQAMNLVSAVAINLEYLRARGIVHGDLKPQNIFLPTDYRQHRDGQLFRLKLSDFSLGRTSQETNEARAGLGTLGYMAPETIRESKASHSSDLFALGTIAYQLLTGRHPFLSETNDPSRVTSMTLEESSVPIRDLRSDLPPALSELVHSLLSADDAKRPGSAWEVCERLSAIGCEYPYQKVLRPHYLIDADKSVEKNIRTLIGGEQRYIDRLRHLCGDSSKSLRLLTTANFNRGALKYTGSRFEFVSDVYWPVRIRNALLGEYQEASAGQRKAIVRASIVGSGPLAAKLDVITEKQAESIPGQLPELVLPLLHSKTVRAYSPRCGYLAERAEEYGAAVSLYIQAGKLEHAEQCAYQESAALRNEHKNNEALRLVGKVIEYARTVDQEFIARQLWDTRGDIYKDCGRTDEALKAYQKVIDLYADERPDKLLAETYKNLGDLYKLKQNYQEGLAASEKALAIFTDLNDELEVSHTYNNIANINFVKDDKHAALKFYRKALKIQRRLEVKPEVASTITNIGGLYCMMGRLPRGIKLLSLGLELKREIGNIGEIARSLNNLGISWHFYGENDKAIGYLTESLELNKRIGSQKEAVLNLDNLTEIMTASGQLRESLEYLRESMRLCEGLGENLHRGDNQLNISIILGRTGNIEGSVEAVKEAETIAESVDNEPLRLSCALQRACIRQFVGDYAGATAEASKVLTEAEERKDNKNRLIALRLLTELSDSLEYLERARVIAEQQGLNREKAIFEFARIQYQLDQGQSQAAINGAGSLLKTPLEWEKDIELPWMCNVAAEVLIEKGQPDQAEQYLTRGKSLCESSGQKPELITAMTLLGKLAFQRGDYEKCHALYRQALGHCKSVAATIKIETDQSSYLSRRSIKFLTSEIRRLGKFLTK